MYLYSHYKQTWYSNINNSTRLQSYSLIKHELNLETYLKVLSNKKYRIALCKFRLSAHNLNIEAGRYENIPRQNRKCIYCNMNQVEDEYHFLLVVYGHSFPRTFVPTRFLTGPDIRAHIK